MKILGIVGSKRKKGNTYHLVERALKGAESKGAQTELIYLGDYSINGCIGCEGCKESFTCVINDDMQKLYPLLLEADGLILGSPTYFYDVSADVKAFIDRCYCFDVFADDDRSCWVSVNEALGGKYAAVVAVCEQHEEKYMGFTADVMTKSLMALGYRVVDTVKAIGFWGPGEVLNDNKLMTRTEKAGERIVSALILRDRIKSKMGLKK